MARTRGRGRNIRTWLGLVALIGSTTTWVAATASPSAQAASRCTIVGTAGSDVLVGTPGRDVICGFGGDDEIRGLAGNDVLRGGDGNDRLVGGSGIDRVWGGAGDDVLLGGSDDDLLRGGSGDDVLRGGPGNDGLRGGYGDDRLIGGPGTDRLFGKQGADVIIGGPGRDGITCEPDGKDTIIGGGGDAVGPACNALPPTPPTPTPPTPPTPPARHAPVAVDDTVETSEDVALHLPVSGAGSPVANDTDVDGDVLTVTAVAAATGGTVVVIGPVSGAEVRFTPQTDLCGPASAGFDYTVSDGTGGTDTGRVSIDVDCVPDAPRAVDDAVTLDEDAGATVVDVLSNDSDADGDALTVAAVSAPSGGQVVLDQGTVRFTPDADLCGVGAAGFDYVVEDDTGRSDTGRAVIDLRCADDAPVARDDVATVDEDATSAPIDVLDNDTDPDGEALVVASTTDPAHGAVAITSTGVGYTPDADYCNSQPGGAPDTFTYSLSGSSTSATVTVTVECIDDRPTAVADSFSVAAGSTGSLPVVANDVDPDGGPMLIAGVDAGVGGVSIENDRRSVTYSPGPDLCDVPGVATDSDSFVYSLNGGSSAEVSITVSCGPWPSTANPDSAAVSEDASATAIDVLANDEVRDGTLSIQSVTQPAHGTVAITGAGAALSYEPDPDFCNAPSGAAETFTYTLVGGSTATVTMTVTCVVDAVVAVDDAATVLEDAAATAIDVLANDERGDGTLSIVSVTQPAHGSVVITGGGTGLTYAPAPDYCNNPPITPFDTFTYTVAVGTTATVSMTVVCVTDPAVAVEDVVTIDEDTVVTVDVLANDRAHDETLQIASLVQPARGTATVTVGGVAYTPAANDCGTATLQYVLTGGSSATLTITITCVNDTPSAADVSLTGAQGAIGNTTLIVDDPTDAAPTVTGARKQVAGDLLAGATDVDSSDLTIVGGTVVTSLGGSVVLQADGDFVYTPPPGCIAGVDEFSYAVSDGDATGQGQVSIGRAPGCVRYVSNDAAGSAGTSSAPFDTLAQAVTSSGPGDVIHVAGGNGTSTGYDAGAVLKADQLLVGEGVDLVVGGITLLEGEPAARPVLTAGGLDVVTVASGAAVSGVQIDPNGASSGIAGSFGAGGGSITGVRVVDAGVAGTRPGVDLSAATGSTTITDLHLDTTAATGQTATSVGVQLAAGPVTFSGSTVIKVKGARALVATGTNLATSEFDRVEATASTSGGISLTDTTGAVTLTDVAIETSGGASAGLAVRTTGTLTVPATGSATITTIGGPAVDVATGSGSSLSFDQVSSTGSATRGVSLSLQDGTFAAASGALTGHAQGAFVVTGGSGAISWDGTIGNGAGRSLQVSGRTGGTVTLSRAIADGAGVGGGLSITGNSGGATVLTAAGTTLDTAATDAIVFTGNGANGGHALTLGGGGLAIATTSGRGIDASGGSLVVTGSANRITTGSGRALGLVGTRIGAGGLTFERISATGAPNGILLNGTGDLGSLTVTGAGGTCTAADTSGCSGGTIAGSVGGDDSGAAPVGAGIVLTDTLTPSLTRMWVNGASNYGIRGDRTRGLALTNSVVNGALGTTDATPYDDSAVLLTNLSGTPSITDSFITGGHEDSLRVSNVDTSLGRLTIANVAFARDGLSPRNDAISLDSDGTGAFAATLRDSEVQGAAGDVLQFSHAASNGGDLVLTGNAFANDHPAVSTGGGGVSISQPSAGGAMTTTITGNSFRGAVGAAVLVVKAGTQPQTGTFANNQVGVSGVVDSGSVSGSALKLQQAGGGGQMSWQVTGNQVRGYNNYGLEVLAGGGGPAETGAVKTVVTGNTIAEPGSHAGSIHVAKQGIHYTVGTATGDAFDVCADIRDNVLGESGAGTYVPAGGVTDVGLRQRYSTTLRLPGLPTPVTTAGVAQHVAAQNSTGTPAVHATITAPGAIVPAPSGGCP